ncbi:hypothetical protein M758_7G021700 [Ceratodon purpureus]|uniref:phosphoglycerate mutase (2,3-diphosphoglycerate-dependent) n=1 Tax=Ceratodon purpureus TaxID=3225 RepID=A0A8T0H573_CERPU|nr:hypothetical protein KC19_7G022600 [Ceratodon purpureus]KAG0609889.1 hypothetical protein M758_7G021700 [Ceratodon purpureus]
MASVVSLCRSAGFHERVVSCVEGRHSGVGGSFGLRSGVAFGSGVGSLRRSDGCTSSGGRLSGGVGRLEWRVAVVAKVRRSGDEVVTQANGAPASKTESALILIRHGESLWNSKNLFTGCVDVPLSEKGVNEAIEAGKRISDMPVDMIFTSALIRAQMTAMLAMTQHHRQKVPVILHNESERAEAWSRIFSEGTDDEVIPVVTAWQLNERMYGELQGLNKKETADKFGAEKVHEWRRSYDIPPPNGESLEMCAKRSVEYFKKNVVPMLSAGKNIMIAAHGNSLRAIIMYLDSLTPQEVIELELTTGIPMLYTFKDSKFLRRGSPVGPTVAGVYALTKVRDQLEF